MQPVSSFALLAALLVAAVASCGLRDFAAPQLKPAVQPSSLSLSAVDQPRPFMGEVQKVQLMQRPKNGLCLQMSDFLATKNRLQGLTVPKRNLICTTVTDVNQASWA